MKFALYPGRLQAALPAHANAITHESVDPMSLNRLRGPNFGGPIAFEIALSALQGEREKKAGRV
jgi:hypothetical protein